MLMLGYVSETVPVKLKASLISSTDDMKALVVMECVLHVTSVDNVLAVHPLFTYAHSNGALCRVL